MRLLEEIWNAIQIVIKWIGQVFSAFPNWFEPSGWVFLILGVVIIKKLIKSIRP